MSNLTKRHNKKTEIVQVLNQNLAQNPVMVLIAKYPSRHSRRAVIDSLRLFTGWLKAKDPITFPWHTMTYTHVQALRAKLLQEYPTPATARRHLSMLKGVLKECWRLNLMDFETWSRIDDVDGISGETLPAGRALTVDEIGKLFDACGDLREYEGARDAALLACAYYAGMRHEELLNLQLDAFDPSTGDLRIFGKGRKERSVRLSKKGRSYVTHWILIRGITPGQLLWGPHRRPLTYSYITDRLQHLCLTAGISRFTAHDLRRTFVTHLLVKTQGDLKTVRDLAGHSKIETTARYDRRSEEVRQRATALLDD